MKVKSLKVIGKADVSELLKKKIKENIPKRVYKEKCKNVKILFLWHDLLKAFFQY